MTESSERGGSARAGVPERPGVLTAAAESLFDDLTRQAAEACSARVAALSVVERGRQWVKSRGGIGSSDAERMQRLCSEALRSGDGLAVSDLQGDQRFSPRGEAVGLRFFAGVPIRTVRAGAVGTLAVLDGPPRDSADDVLEHLRDLAREAARQLDIRLGAEEVLGSGRPREAPRANLAEPEFRLLVERSPVGTYVIQDERYRYANPRLGEILGYEAPQLLGAEVAPLVIEADRAEVLARLRESLVSESQAPYVFRAVRRDGRIVHVEAHEAPTELDG